MFGLPANWRLAITAALTSTLTLSPAHARGGGHAGAMAHPMMSTSHFATTPLPGIGVWGVNPGAGMRGGMLPQPPGPLRSPSTIVPSAIVSRPQTLQSPFGATSRNGRASAGAAGLLNSGIGAIPTPPPEGVTPQSEVASPAPEPAPIAPLSPQLQTQFSTDGVAQPNLALSPGAASSASPSESAPSAPGGGGKSLADCMGFWDRETHMTKAEWKAACMRTMQDEPTVLR